MSTKNKFDIKPMTTKLEVLYHWEGCDDLISLRTEFPEEDSPSFQFAILDKDKNPVTYETVMDFENIEEFEAMIKDFKIRFESINKKIDLLL